jgi:hypothetical protein
VRGRSAAALLLCTGVVAGVATAEAVGADTQRDRAPTQLWNEYPLDPIPQTTRTEQPRPAAATPPRDDAPSMTSDGANPVVWIVGALLLVPLVLLARRNLGRIRHVPILGGPRVAAHTGTLVPLAPVLEAWSPPRRHVVIPREPWREPAPPPEPEPEPEPRPEPVVEATYDPVGPITVRDLRRAAVATTYEIAWYRTGERIAFGLQPLDGRAARDTYRRSASFRWDEDCDPPHDLRDAQRAHGRLRSRLMSDGWTPAGRGAPWFAHRFHPPR